MTNTVPTSDSRPVEVQNRSDEWKIEQGLAGAKLPFLDQTGETTVEILPTVYDGPTKDEAAIKAVGNPDELFQREREGWQGYVSLPNHNCTSLSTGHVRRCSGALTNGQL